MVDAPFSRHLHRLVPASVVNDQVLDLVYSRQLPGQIVQGHLQGFRLVVTRYLRPILEGEADIVVGARPIDETEHFSFVKKKLQHFGSWVVRKASNTDIPDAPSGFRAMSREAAMRLNVVNDYTYTLETIRLPFQNGPDQGGNVKGAVLVVRVRVHDTQYHARRAEYDALYLQQKMEKEAARTYRVVGEGGGSAGEVLESKTIDAIL